MGRERNQMEGGIGVGRELTYYRIWYGIGGLKVAVESSRFAMSLWALLLTAIPASRLLLLDLNIRIRYLSFTVFLSWESRARPFTVLVTFDTSFYSGRLSRIFF